MKKLFSIFVTCLFLTANGMAQSKADSLLQFISGHPQNASLRLVVNDTVVAGFRDTRPMPLASTVKLMVALEFAKQVAAHVADSSRMIPLASLNRYYIPFTDGNAHPQWLAYERSRNHIQNDSIALIHVARGMMMFSSNANTDFLLELLGLENVQNNTALLGLKNHGKIFPLAASLFLYQNPKNKKETEILKSIRSMKEEEYLTIITKIHRALTHEDELKKKFRPQDLSPAMQKLWSDRLTTSTTRDYTQLANVLNNRKYFSAPAYGVFARVAETLMESPANTSWLAHAGMKGGSTPWVLTKCLYATDLAGNKIELAYFFNDLEPAENLKLQKWMNDFEREVTANAAFRANIREVLSAK